MIRTSNCSISRYYPWTGIEFGNGRGHKRGSGPQQGRFVADVAYFYGEEAPLTILQDEGRLDDVPKGYGFDFVNAEALLEQLQVKDGNLVSASGMRYRAPRKYRAGRRQRRSRSAR